MSVTLWVVSVTVWVVSVTLGCECDTVMKFY